VAHSQTIDVSPPATAEPWETSQIVDLDEADVASGPERGVVRQVAVTIVAKVKPRQVSQLKRTLEAVGDDAAGNEVLPFGRLSTTHFARLVFLEESEDLAGKRIPPQLVYMSDVDAPLGRHLDELVDAAGTGLDRIFANCEGYPARRAGTRVRRLAFLREHMVDAGAVYANTVGRTVRQVRREAALHDAIERFLDGADWRTRRPEEVRAAVQDFVNTQPALAWARAPLPDPGLADRVRETAGALRVPLALLAAAPVLVPALPLWALLVRLHELRDPAEHLKPDEAHLRRLTELEDHAVQNQFTAIGHLKRGPVRRATTVGVLRLVGWAARYVFNHGSLTGVKTIHFARWVMLDDNRRLIFASNYDGSLESYMDDFIDKVAWGLNAVFSNGFGYPETRFLLWDGARDELAFKDHLRRHQIPTQVWYSAYPHLSAANIENNAHIRAGLTGAMSPEEVERWLRRI
jgi:hypothetical protein